MSRAAGAATPLPAPAAPRIDMVKRVVVVALLIGLPAGAWLVGRSSRSAEESAALHEPPAPAVLTAEVERRPLVRDLVTRGTVEAVGAVDVAVPAPEGDVSPIVTATPVAVGDAVAEGQALLGVAGRPVIFLAGAFPAYRDLRVGDSGPDVEQLEAALGRLGLRPGRLDGLYDADLAAAVRRAWQAAGYDPWTAPLDDAEALGTAEEAPTAPPVYPMVPRSEVWFGPTAPLTVAALRVRVGSTVDGSPMRLARGGTVVIAEVSGSDAALVRSGAAVVVEGDAGGEPRDGLVAEEPRMGDGSEGPATASVRVELPQPFSVTDAGQGVKVTIRVAATDGPVLVVPLVAIAASSDGRDHVVVVKNGQDRQVGVKVGLTVNGEAEVRGSLEPGDVVRIG